MNGGEKKEQARRTVSHWKVWKPRLPVYTMEEVQQHRSIESCWILNGNYIYDVTSFLPLHPAGKEAILRKSGQDVSEDFYFHSKSAQKLWESYLIGYVETPNPSCVLQ